MSIQPCTCVDNSKSRRLRFYNYSVNPIFIHEEYEGHNLKITIKIYLYASVYNYNNWLGKDREKKQSHGLIYCTWKSKKNAF